MSEPAAAAAPAPAPAAADSNNNKDNKDKDPNAPADPTNPTSAIAEPAAPPVKVDPSKDLWQNIAANVKETAQDSTDQTVLVVGVKGAGKTSIIQRMLGATSSGSPKATTALEYSYGKREERNTTQLAHFWELAQGMELSQLADVVVTPENVHSVLMVIVLDCADPSTAWEHCVFWLKKLDNRAQEMFQKMRAKGSQTPDKMLARAKKRFGDDHPDLKRLRTSGIPTVIICSRLDKYNLDTGKLKQFARTMRYLAHLYGASLIFTSDHEREATKLRALLNHLIFSSPFDAKYTQLDTDKGGVLVPAGTDSFATIGDPTPTNMGNFKPTGDGELDRWKAPFDEFFPPTKAHSQGEDEEGKKVGVAADDKQFLAQLYDTVHGFGEPLVDAMRKQKAEELEQYRKNASSKKSEKHGKE